MLCTALGPAIAAFLEDPTIVEVMLNPDGRSGSTGCRAGSPIRESGCRRPTSNGSSGSSPTMSAPRSMPAAPHGSRPSCPNGRAVRGTSSAGRGGATFAIRKPAVAVFTLDDYAAAGIMSAAQAVILRRAVAERRNILVAGGSSTGKTTLTNALLAEVAKTADRVVLIEDTRELQCLAPNLVELRTKDGVVSLSDIVRSSLRLGPDRIPIGEVRGAEALDLLKAWGTGHPGGVGPFMPAAASARCAGSSSSSRKPLFTVSRPDRRDHRSRRGPRRPRIGAAMVELSMWPASDRTAITPFQQQENPNDP